MWSVYMHINKVNQKKYIGITSRPVEKRWMKGLGYSRNLKIGRAFEKYGWDSFEHIILYQNLSEFDAKEIEKKLIKEFKTQDDEFGYNITSGGDGVTGWHPSYETRHKMSESAKKRVGEKNSNFGNKWSDAQKAEMAEKHKRENLSESTLKKMSESASKRTGNKNSFYGKHHTEETKKKISESRKKPVIMYDKEMNELKKFDCTLDAAEYMNVTPTAIQRCCKGVAKTCCGFIWKYEIDL